jgi:hypothetical protein
MSSIKPARTRLLDALSHYRRSAATTGEAVDETFAGRVRASLAHSVTPDDSSSATTTSFLPSPPRAGGLRVRNLAPKRWLRIIAATAVGLLATVVVAFEPLFTATPGSPPPSPSPTASSVTFLTDLVPTAGAENISRMGENSFVMGCGTAGIPGDARHVYYAPTRSFRAFSAGVRASDASTATIIDVTLVINERAVTTVDLQPGEEGLLAWRQPADRPVRGEIILQVYCGDGLASVLFVDPTLIS